MKPIDENHLLDIVDQNDIVIGQDTKENKFKKELISRNVVAFIKNSQNKYIIVKRSSKKKVFPNLFDLAACGHVLKGESPDKAILREIKEELGISCKVKLLEKKFNNRLINGKRIKYFTSIFLGKSDSKIKLNKELSNYILMSLDELLNLIKNKPELFSPFLIDELQEIKYLLKRNE